MKVNIIRNELARKRSDYKFGYKTAGGEIAYHDCDYKDGERLPLRKSELAILANSEYRRRDGCGWQVFPRYSYTIELLESYRDDDGKPRNRFIWSATYNPNSPIGKGYEVIGEAIKRRFDFWKRLERQLVKHKVAPDNADRIRNQIAEVIPLVTKEEFATMEADLKRLEANKNAALQMM